MSMSWAKAWRVGATAVLLLGWAVAAHLGSAGAGSADVNAALAVLPIVIALAVLLWQAHSRWLLAVGLVVAGGVVWVLWPQLRQNISLLYYLQHLGSHLALAVFFGRTMWGAGDALVTNMARFIYGDALSARKVRYTRQVTVAWTVFFVANALVSTGLFLWAPLAVWSAHANLLTGPLIALMFLVEHQVRKRLLPPHERPSLAEALRAYRQRLDQGSMARRRAEPRA
jgi:uncharacterized membrane protein